MPQSKSITELIVTQEGPDAALRAAVESAPSDDEQQRLADAYEELYGEGGAIARLRSGKLDDGLPAARVEEMRSGGATAVDIRAATKLQLYKDACYLNTTVLEMHAGRAASYGDDAKGIAHKVAWPRRGAPTSQLDEERSSLAGGAQWRQLGRGEQSRGPWRRDCFRR